MKQEFIRVGRIVNAHGIKGELKLNPEGFTPEFVAAFDTLYVNGEPVRVKSRRVHKSTLLLTLPGVEDMDAALALARRNWEEYPAMEGADWYLCGKDFTWTYAQTHEAACGPYFARAEG